MCNKLKQNKFEGFDLEIPSCLQKIPGKYQPLSLRILLHPVLINFDSFIPRKNDIFVTQK
jgi:hypothetical protein